MWVVNASDNYDVSWTLALMFASIITVNDYFGNVGLSKNIDGL